MSGMPCPKCGSRLRVARTDSSTWGVVRHRKCDPCGKTYKTTEKAPRKA